MRERLCVFVCERQCVCERERSLDGGKTVVLVLAVIRAFRTFAPA